MALPDAPQQLAVVHRLRPLHRHGLMLSVVPRLCGHTGPEPDPAYSDGAGVALVSTLLDDTREGVGDEAGIRSPDPAHRMALRPPLAPPCCDDTREGAGDEADPEPDPAYSDGAGVALSHRRHCHRYCCCWPSPAAASNSSAVMRRGTSSAQAFRAQSRTSPVIGQPDIPHLHRAISAAGAAAATRCRHPPWNPAPHAARHGTSARDRSLFT